MIGRREHIERASADSTGTDVDRPRDGNVFRRTGDIWQVVFDGKQVLLKDSKGVHYLEFLLKNPDQPFLALHLVMDESGQLPKPNETYSTMSAEELAEEGLNSIGFTDEDVEKARSSVTHAINFVLQKLRDHHSSLYDHLHASLIHGREISYRPATSTIWKF